MPNLTFCPHYPIQCGSGRSAHQRSVLPAERAALPEALRAQASILKCISCGCIYTPSAPEHIVHGKLGESASGLAFTAQAPA